MSAFLKLIGSYKFNSILMRNFLIVFLLLSLPLGGLTVYVYLFNRSVMEEEMAQAALGNISRVRDTVDMIFKEVSDLSLRMHSDTTVESLQRSDLAYQFNYNDVQRLLELQNNIKLSESTNPFISSISVYFDRQHYLLTSVEGRRVLSPDEEWWYESYSSHPGNNQAWFEASTSSPAHISQFRKLSGPSSRTEGVIIVNMDANRLGRIIQNTIQSQTVFIVDETGTVLFGQNPASVGMPFDRLEPQAAERLNRGTWSHVVRRGDQERVVSVTASDYFGWRYVSLIPLTEYQEKLARFNRLTYLLITFSVAAAIMLAFVISVKNYEPIMKIISLLEKGNDGLFLNGKRASQRLDEIKYIASTIIQSNHEREELLEQLSAKYQALRKAQIIALQSQINPHFLFNTLETINWKAMMLTNGRNDASDMIGSLSKLLRYSLDTEEEFISIGEEMEFVRVYLEIQMIRYRDTIHVQWQLADEFIRYRMLKLLLQPIVENAIYHGIKPSERPGLITITGYCRDGAVVLRIRDNGAGMKKAMLDKLNADFRKDEIKENEQIGLNNVNQRIRLMFGKKYGLKIRSVWGQGTVVELSLPRMEA